MKYISHYGDKDRENTLLLSVSFRFLFVFCFSKLLFVVLQVCRSYIVF